MNPETAVTFTCGHFNQVVFPVNNVRFLPGTATYNLRINNGDDSDQVMHAPTYTFGY